MPRATLQLSDKEAGQLARKAAEKIRENGWTTGELFGDEGKVCLIGALALTSEKGRFLRQSVEAGSDRAVDSVYVLPEVREFAKIFSEWNGVAEMDATSYDRGDVDLLWRWNDDLYQPSAVARLKVAPPETQEDILAVLDKFACEMDPEGSYP